LRKVAVIQTPNYGDCLSKNGECCTGCTCSTGARHLRSCI